MRAKIATQQLQVAIKQIQTAISLDLDKYATSVSYGTGYFPKIPWVGITPKFFKVSNSISVCICFSKAGEGLVCGAMFSEVKTKGPCITKTRSLETDKYILLAGGNNRTNYTNKFVNPKDFYKDEINESDLLNHIKESLILMDEYKINND